MIHGVSSLPIADFMKWIIYPGTKKGQLSKESTVRIAFYFLKGFTKSSRFPDPFTVQPSTVCALP